MEFNATLIGFYTKMSDINGALGVFNNIPQNKKDGCI